MAGFHHNNLRHQAPTIKSQVISPYSFYQQTPLMGFDFLNALTKGTKCFNDTKSQEKCIWHIQETLWQEKQSQASMSRLPLI